MRNLVSRLVASSMVVAFAVGSAFAQDARVAAAAGDFVISAKAGGVSAFEGDVSIARTNGASQRPSRRDSLEIGDVVSTGSDGKIELMLNPGSFVRLGPNSKFSFITTDLDNLVLRLDSGSAVLEVYAGDDFAVRVKTPGAVLPVNRSGVFRIDVLADGSSKISVWKGRLVVGTQKVTLKSGRAMVAQGKTGGITKFDRDEKDALDIWSQTRGREVAKANAKLERKALKGSLISAYRGGAWDMYRSFGVWVFDSQLQRWFFLPFGSGWRSPYGHDYGNDIWRFGLPYWVFYPNVTVTNGNSGGGSPSGSVPGGTGAGSGTGTASVPPGPGGWRTGNKDTEGVTRGQLPVFRQFENTQRVYGDSPVVSFPDGGFRGSPSGVWGGGGASGGGGGGIDSRPTSGGAMQTIGPTVSAPGQSRVLSKDDN